MSVAQTKAARRKNLNRYRGGQKHKSISQSIADERAKAARAAAIKRK